MIGLFSNTLLHPSVGTNEQKLKYSRQYSAYASYMVYWRSYTAFWQFLSLQRGFFQYLFLILFNYIYFRCPEFFLSLIRMKSKNDIPGEISLDQAGIVLSHSVRLLDILGDAECQRIVGQQFVTFLVNEVKIELGRYFAEFEKF